MYACKHVENRWLLPVQPWNQAVMNASRHCQLAIVRFMAHLWRCQWKLLIVPCPLMPYRLWPSFCGVFFFFCAVKAASSLRKMTLPQIELPTAPPGGQTMTTQAAERLTWAPGPLLWNRCSNESVCEDLWGVLNPNCASNFNQSYPDDCAEMGLEFWHAIRAPSSSGFYFLSTDVCEPGLVKWDRRERMTESQRYLSWSREASPVGPSGQGLP